STACGVYLIFFFQAEDGIRDGHVTGVQTCALPISPAYMSPEQASGGGPIDGRSDVYSLACVLYEMLVGEPPYTGPSAQVVIAKRSEERRVGKECRYRVYP